MSLVESINKRRNEEIKFTAAIHGAELKGSKEGKSLDLENDIDKLGKVGIDVVKG